MPYSSFDTNGNLYTIRNLPRNLGGSGISGKWTTNDFPQVNPNDLRTNVVDRSAVFNFHFQPGVMTDVELEYLNSLIEEYKSIEKHQYVLENKRYLVTPTRKEEIWRALNWAPVRHQFVNTILDEKISRFKNQNVKLTTDDKNYWTFIDFENNGIQVSYAELEKRSPSDFAGEYFHMASNLDGKMVYIARRPSAEVQTGIYTDKNFKIENASDFFSIEKKFQELQLVETPLFILDINTIWKESYPKKPFKLVGTNEPISNVPFNKLAFFGKTDSPQEFFIDNLDYLIQTKHYNGNKISDQELVFWIRYKYGIAYADETVIDIKSSEDGLIRVTPVINYYRIPFYNDEATLPGSVGKNTKNLNFPVVTNDYTFDEQLEDLSSVNFSNSQNLIDGHAITNESWQNIENYEPSAYADKMKIINFIIKNQTHSGESVPGIQNSGLEYITWNQIFYFSTIRAYWRASKIINEIMTYCEYIRDGLEKDPGQIDSVIAAGGTIPIDVRQPSGNISKQNISTLFFISGNPYGDSVEKHLNTEKYSYRERPWNEKFGIVNSNQINSYASDRNVRTNNQCNNTTQYMRHLILPRINKYISEYLYTGSAGKKQIEYTKIAIDKRVMFYKQFWNQYFTEDGMNDSYKYILHNVIGYDIELPNYENTKNFVRNFKLPIFTGKMFSVLISDLIGDISNVFYKTIHFIISRTNHDLSTYKIGSGLITQNLFRAGKNLSLYFSTHPRSNHGFELTYPQGNIKISKISGFYIGLSTMVSLYLYDKWNYSRDPVGATNEFVKRLNEATLLNLIEGVYASTDGVIGIKKGNSGQLLVGFQLSPNQTTVNNKYMIYNKTESLNNSIGRNGGVRSEIDRKNANKYFLESTDVQTQFFDRLTKIECDTILKIGKFGKWNRPNPSYNPILNSAPDFLDIGPLRDTGGFITNLNKFKSWELYFTLFGNNVNSIKPDYEIIYNAPTRGVFGGDFVLPELKFTPSSFKLMQTRKQYPAPWRLRTYGTRFFYTRAIINSSTDLTNYLQGIVVPSEGYYVVGITNDGKGPIKKFLEQTGEEAITNSGYDYERILWKYSNEDIFTTYPNRTTSGFEVTDKEKIWLIRKKYNLNHTISYKENFCCSVFNTRSDNELPSSEKNVNIFSWPPTENLSCEYVIDFSSPEFIKRVEEVYTKKQDKKIEIQNRESEFIVDIATKYGFIEKKQMQSDIKIAEKTPPIPKTPPSSQNIINYQGSSEHVINLSQLPRFGAKANLPGSIQLESPVTDSMSTVDIEFEMIDTQKKASLAYIISAIISVFGDIIGKQIQIGVRKGQVNKRRR